MQPQGPVRAGQRAGRPQLPILLGEGTGRDPEPKVARSVAPLNDYFAARQWYATVVFRLSHARETRLALSLALLVGSDPELMALWKRLGEPFDILLAPVEDGTVEDYLESVRSVLGTNLHDANALEHNLRTIWRRLETRLALPLVNLGAWAEQRHTWALHVKLSVGSKGLAEPPAGMVAPYPEFFSGLAKLTRRTAATFAAAGLDQSFEVKTIARDLMDAFAPLCDRLAELANKSLNRRALSDEDARWIDGYGITLANFHFYYGNSYLHLLDDFPMVTRVYSNPLTGSMAIPAGCGPASTWDPFDLRVWAS